MTDRRPNSIEQCIADITECPICNEVLQDNRCLPCLHTFCRKCLESYKKTTARGKPLSCPVCRREYAIPKSVSDLSRNFFVDKLIAAHKIKKPELSPKNCEICSEDTNAVPAKRFCCDCHQNLCISCEKQHKRIAATSMHKIIDSANATDKRELTSRLVYCFAHKTKEAEVYCQDCKKIMCWECKSSSHHSHTSMTTNNAAKDFIAKLETHIEQISEHLRIKHVDIQKVADSEKYYTDEVEVESASICRELSKLYKNITDNGDKLKKALSASTAVPLDTFRLLRDKLDSDVNRLKKHKVYVEQMIHLGNVSDLCEYTDALISETARMAEENTCTINAPAVLHLSDVVLQELLIGKRTDIDEQYKHNGRKQQLRINMPPGGYSNEGDSPKEQSCGTSPVKLRRGGAFKDSEKKLIKPGSNTIKEALKPMPLPRSHSRDKDTNGQSKGASCAASGAKPGEVSPGTHDIGTLKQVAEGNRESHSLLQNLCKVPRLTADVSSVNSLSSGPFAECNNGSLLRTIICEDGLAVCGITILDSNIYTVFQNSNNIQVYDSAALVFRNSFTIDEMVNPNDLTSCSLNNCLYICDWGNGRIFRFEVGEGGQHMSWSIDADLGGLSVTAEHNVLLSGHASNKLKEYTSKGQLIRSVTLKDYLNPWHAIKLISNDFIICHGDSLRESGNHRVCLVDANGKLKAFFGGAKGSDEEHMFGPYYLAVDKNDCILVSDCNNRRILLLSQDLKFIKEIIPSSTNVLRRARRMYLDEAAGRLYVADNVSTGRETKDGRILVFSIT